MDSPSMETVYQAIGALYDNPNANEKEKASLWLGDMQKSIHSWKIADELLQQKKDVHSCYFAAQTMRSKVQHNLSELPSESLVSLRDSLVAHLERTTPDTSSAILTQLCLALADLALQMPTWQNCISDLIKSFSTKNAFALLEILTVLPQEIDSTSLKLGENRREGIKMELRNHSNIVTMFLKESITTSQNSHVALKIVKCMTSWIQVKAINIQEVPQNAVLGFCLQVLRDHNSINTLHDAAADCVCVLLHCLEENNNNENIERLLFESIASLEESYHLAVAHEEEEKAANYARVFTELGEAFLEKIIACTASGNTHFAMRSLELALVCVGHHDYEVAEITFNLWYRLSEDLYHRDYQPLNDAFKPHVERLIEALARHCQCEPDQSQLLEEGDEFYEFRHKVMGLIKDVVFIVGSSCVFRQMFGALRAAAAPPAPAPAPAPAPPAAAAPPAPPAWAHMEAALFIMQCVAKNILPEEYEFVPKVVEAILSIPPEGTHIAVRKTCILLLGELCEWIEQHPACLEPTLQFLILTLQDKRLAPSAATALQNICKSCRAQLGAPGAAGGAAGALQAGALLAAAQQVEQLHTSATLMRAVAAVIGCLPHHQLSQAMREATYVQTTGLTAAIKSREVPSKGSVKDPVVWLDRLAALFRDVDVPQSTTSETDTHPALPALSDAWPVLRDTMERFGSDGRVMERLCRCVRFALRCLGAHAAPLLPALAHAMRQLYALHAHSCVLYLASVLVDELASTAECVPELIALLQELMPRAFQLLQEENGLRNNPDTVDDLFRLCIRFLQRIPLEFLVSGAPSGALRCGCVAAALDHRDANASVMKLLHDLARAACSPRPERSQVQALAAEIIAAHGADLTFALLEASALHLHAYMLGDVAEVLLELLQFQQARAAPGGAGEWLRAALQRLPRDRAAQPTDQQCYQFHQAAVRADKVKELTRLLKDFARLYR